MNFKKRIFLLSLGLIISFIISTTALARDKLATNVTLEGSADGIVYVPGEEPFLYFSDMIPGDSIERKMKINNKEEKAYKLYMRAERVSAKEQYDLLEKINLKVLYNNEVIYNGPVSGEEKLSDNIYLGTVNSGEEYELNALAILDGKSSDNNYKNKSGEVKWIFTAERSEEDIVINKTNNIDKVVEVKNNIIRNFKTGDPSGIVFILILITSIGVIVYVNGKRYLNKRENRYEK